MNQKRNHLLRWLGTIGAVILLVFLFQKQGWDEIWAAFQQVNIDTFLLCLLLILISRLAVVGRWHSLLSCVEEVTLWQSIRITFAGLFASNFLPTTIGGDVVRLAGTVQLNLDGAVSTASLIVDRMIGMTGMVLALPFGAKPMILWFRANKIPKSSLSYGLLFSWTSGAWKKAGDLLQRIYQSIKIWSKHPRSLLVSLLFTGIHMLCFFGTITLLLNDMGEQLPLTMVAGLWSFVYFITLLPVSINGFGVQEISMAFIFNEVGGISLQSSLTISILFRTLMMLGSVPGVLFLPGIIAGSKKQGDVI